jgi:PAS domain S-box-containing protein
MKKAVKALFHEPYRVLTKKGEMRWVEDRTYFRRDASGRISRYRGIILDITDRKTAEEIAAQFGRILDDSLNEIYIFDAKTFKFLQANHGAQENLGYSIEEIRKLTPIDIKPEYTIESFEAMVRPLLTGRRKKLIFETIHERKDGSTYPVEVHLQLSTFKSKSVYVAVILDISERKQNEEELRRLRNYLSNIIDSMPSILVAVDRDGKVTQWNRQTEQTTGVSTEEARSRPLAEVLPHLAHEMARIGTAIRERRVITSPKVPRKMARETRFEDVTIYPLVANGVEGAVIRVDDVTEQVRLEEMMIQSEKMITVGGLAAGMAHEINNPLAGMMQTAEVLTNRLKSNLNIPVSQEAAEAAGTTITAIEQFMNARGIPRMLKAITTSGRRVADIVENMLSFARKDDTVVSSHRLEKILEKTLELAATDYDLKKQYDFRLIEIVKAYGENVPAVPCQESKIQQVLLNILSNGAHAMQASKTANPRFIIRTYTDPDRNMACMDVEDNGPGMDETTRKQVFEPFFTTKAPGVGTGLGLSVSYFIITENHRGEMSVASHPGSGTKFTVRLPLKGGNR